MPSKPVSMVAAFFATVLSACAPDEHEGSPSSGAADDAAEGGTGEAEGSTSAADEANATALPEGTSDAGDDESSEVTPPDVGSGSTDEGDDGEAEDDAEEDEGDGSNTCPTPATFNGDGDIAALSDEFDDPATLCAWTWRHEQEADDVQFSMFDVNATVAGQAAMIPTTSGWYSDWRGPLMFKQVDGDFIFETSVTASSLAAPGTAPALGFTSVGIMVRNPDRAPGEENWIMLDLGTQDRDGEALVIGYEAKNTTNSQSNLWTENGDVSGRLRICRLGVTFILAVQYDGDPQYVEVNRFERGDMPSLLQAGLIINAWNGTSGMPNFNLETDLLATWDYARFLPIADESECLSP